MFVAALVACSLPTCYRMGLYSTQEFPTKEACEKAFSFIAVTHIPRETRLHVLCMKKAEYELLPRYKNRRN